MNAPEWYIVAPADAPGTLILTDVPPAEYVRRTRNYLPLLHEHHRARGAVAPGVYSTRVEHDDDCGLFRDAPCDCDPTIVSGPPMNRAARRRAERGRGSR